MFKVQNLAISFSGITVFKDVNIVIGKKEKIGLIGRNGSGKSTLLRILMGSLEPDCGEIQAPKNYKIGYLQQHIEFSKRSVLAEVCSVLPEHRIYEEWKGDMILSGLGFSDADKLMDPMSFSGGIQIKINLAKLLLSEPFMLLLDEPTNYLDIHAIRWLQSFLKEWPNEVVLITHNRAFMDSVVTHTIFIHRGTVKKLPGGTKLMYEKVGQEESLHEKARVHMQKQHDKAEEWIRRFKAKATLASRVKSKAKMLAKADKLERLDAIQDLDFDFAYLDYGSKEPMISVKGLEFGYDARSTLIKQLSFRVQVGDKICIVGKNGKGKSTLLKLLVGELEPASGVIMRHSRVRIGYFGQMNIERLNKSRTIFDEINSCSNGAPESKVRSICGKMLFPGSLMDKRISVLSGGEKSRVLLGKIILNPVNLLILDEPTNHLDMESCMALSDAINAFPGAVILITHDEDMLSSIASSMVVFDDDKTYYFDNTYDIFLKKVGWKDL